MAAAAPGVLIADRGHVLTDHHVVSGTDRVTLVLPSGRRIPAEVIGSSRVDDIAVLRATGDTLSAATLGVSDDLRIGQPVIAVGSPLGLDGTVTAGVISALDRDRLRAALRRARRSRRILGSTLR